VGEQRKSGNQNLSRYCDNRVNQNSFSSLVDYVRMHGELRGTKDAIRFLGNGETVTEKISYRGLIAASSSIADGLRTHGLTGQVVLIAMPQGIEGPVAFLACLLAGAIAVTIPFPPGLQSRDRIAAIISDARPAAIIAGDNTPLEELAIFADLPVLRVGRLAAASRCGSDGPAGDQPAFLQYSSGSTRSPVGIAITHQNLVANLAMIAQCFGHTEHSVGVNWLPPFHDMGLVGCILQGLFLGATTVLMPTQSFMQRPVRWLRAIEAHHATTAGGPNFGYDICCRRISEHDAGKLDLRSWDVAFCGAEPVRLSTLEAFHARFSRAGFRRESFMPCYGLAEATLLVTSSPKASGIRAIPALKSTGVNAMHVSCGVPAPGCEVMLFDEAGAIVSEGLGEICVRGSHVAPGYWSGSKQNVLPFQNTYGCGGKSYLRTGDLGFWSGGELVISGRLKNILIVNGRKIHAEDIEKDLLEDKDLSSIYTVAAVAVPGEDREVLALLCEVEPSQYDLARRAVPHIVDLVGRRHGLAARVILLRRGVLPRTTSGKLRRQEALQKLQEGHYAETHVRADQLV
jgi:acyl-CoA synthetase (AMP-forming)/AMP-acid ligase II